MKVRGTILVAVLLVGGFAVSHLLNNTAQIVKESGLRRHRSLQQSQEQHQQPYPLFQSDQRAPTAHETVQPRRQPQHQNQRASASQSQPLTFSTFSVDENRQQSHGSSYTDQSQQQRHSSSFQNEPKTFSYMNEQEKQPPNFSDFLSGGSAGSDSILRGEAGSTHADRPPLQTNIDFQDQRSPSSLEPNRYSSHGRGESGEEEGGSLQSSNQRDARPQQGMNQEQWSLQSQGQGSREEHPGRSPQQLGISFSSDSTHYHAGDGSWSHPAQDQEVLTHGTRFNSNGYSQLNEQRNQEDEYQQPEGTANQQNADYTQGYSKSEQQMNQEGPPDINVQQKGIPLQPISLFSSGDTTFREGDNSMFNPHDHSQNNNFVQSQVIQYPPQQQYGQREEPQQHVSVPDQDPNCEVPNAAEVAVRNPTWTASYPGSGAKLTWKLIRAITGIFTSDDHDHNGRVVNGMVVAIKTHYPSHTDPEVFAQDKLRHIARAILLTRNPLNSIPSYHNFVYEQQNGLLNHSTRAPIDAWIKWRNEFFQQELKTWIDHQKYWLDNYSRGDGKLHLVAMEHLTSEERGAETLKELGAFLARGEQDITDSMVPVERIPCIWDMFVHGRVPGERERRHSHRSGGPTEYPFTQPQLDQMVGALLDFKREYHTYHDLGQIVDEYVLKIEEKKAQIQQL